MSRPLIVMLLVPILLTVATPLAQAKMATNSPAQPPSQNQSQSQNQNQKLQTLAAKKAYIRRVYYTTNQQLKNYRLTKKEDDANSSEGGEIKLYTQQGVLKKAEKHYFGETGNVLYEFYFDANQLVFVFEQTTTYNAPIYFDKPQDGLEAFDSKKSTIKENRYYFYDGRMIDWLDTHKQSVPSSSQRFKSKQQELLRAAIF